MEYAYNNREELERGVNTMITLEQKAGAIYTYICTVKGRTKMENE